MSRSVAAAIVAFAAAVVGCLPNRGAVSPDGGTFYFSLNYEAGFPASGTSEIYALNWETGRLKALTDDGDIKGWCSASSSGDKLFYGIHGQGWQTVGAVELEIGWAKPFTGSNQNYGFPWVVPGLGRYVLAADPLSSGGRQWVVLKEHGEVPLGPLGDWRGCVGNVGLAESKFAVPLWREAKDGQKSKIEVAVWVVDLANEPPYAGEEAQGNGKAAAAKPAKPWPVFTCAAKWTDIPHEDKQPVIDSAFSADGKHLVAAFRGEDGKPTRFFNVDPTGKEQPKQLFTEVGGREPQLVAADGSAFVYLRLLGVKNPGREVVLWRAGGKQTLVIARLPGDAESTFTICRRMKDDRMRIYHICDEGLWLVDAAADGTGAKARRLTHERLAAQKYLADFERALGGVRLSSKEKLSPQQAAAVRSVKKPLEDSAKPLQEALQSAWAAATVWEETPAVGDLR
jgi:hypothetical protein